MLVAARDVKSGRSGSAIEWIEIPDLSSRRLALSSLLLGEITDDAKKQEREFVPVAKGALAGVQISVDRRFARSSRLRYIIFIYNAAAGKNGANKPDVTLRTQIFSRADVVLTSPARQISVEGQDPARLAYAAEIPLDALSAGRYELQITIQDRTAKTDAVREVSFEITR